MKFSFYNHFPFRILPGLGLIFILSSVFSQANFTAKLSSSKVGINQQFTVTYSLTGAKSESFERPPFSGFRLTGQSSISGGGSMQMYVNGQLISGNEGEQSWTYTLMPTALGTFEISPAKVKVNGVWTESSSLKVTVVAGNQNPTPSQSQTQSKQGQPGASTQTQSRQNQPSSDGNLKPDDVLITASADKSSAFIGEPIIITYRIYTRVSIPSYGINKVPSFDGFWSENLIDPTSKPQQGEETINGQRYSTALLRKIIVYPQRSGNLKIEPLEVEIIARIVRQRQQANPSDWMNQMFSNFFSNPFGSDPFSTFPGFGSTFEDIKTTIKSNVLTLNIRELPGKNRTSDFSGQVGSYTLEAWFDKDRILIDDALNLSVKISGNGNMSLLQAPEIQFPKSFDTFDPQVEDNTKITASGITGNKIFKYLIVPREPGSFKIPPIHFTYFDPKTGDYKTLTSEEFRLQVVGQNNSKVSEIETEKDIRFIHLKNRKFSKTNVFFFGSLLYWLIFLIILIAFLILIYFRRKKILLNNDQQLLNYRKATKTAVKRLKKSSKLLESGKTEEFYEETARAIWAYLAHRFSIQQAELSVEKVIFRLNEENIHTEILSLLQETLDFCEFIRFAPGSSSNSPGLMLDNAKNIIRSLEQHIYLKKKNKKF